MNIKDIEWRLLEGKLNVRFHNGVGFMQAYLTEDVRIHVWHPELTVPLESFGNRHDHRFDLVSNILLGTVVDTQFQHLEGEAIFDIYTVKPAHFGDTPVPLRLLREQAFAIENLVKYEQGQSYSVRQGVFHQSQADGLTVTIMRKTNQSDQWARILATPQQVPEHGMARKPSQILLNQLFFNALRKLPLEANETIEKLTQNQLA